MKVTTFTKPKAVISIVVAILFLIDANLILQIFAIHLDAAGIMVARILGGAYLGLGIGFWLIASPKDITPVSARLYGFSEAIAAVACLIATVNGVMNNAGWILVVAYGFFACCFLLVANAAKSAQS